MMESIFYDIIKVFFGVFIIRFVFDFLFGFDLFASSRRAGEKVGDKVVYLYESHKKRKAKKKAKKKPAKTRIRISESKVFHVSSLDGRNKIVQATDEEGALAIAAQAMAVEESELVAQEVYDKVLR